MATKEFPNHTKFRPALQRIIAESVAETLSESDRDIAAVWRDALRSHRHRMSTSAVVGGERYRHKPPKRPS